MLKLALSIIAIVVATLCLSLIVAALTGPDMKPAPNAQPELQRRNAALNSIFSSRPAALRRCGLSLPSGTAVIEASHVRVARCLEGRGLVT